MYQCSRLLVCIRGQDPLTATLLSERSDSNELRKWFLCSRCRLAGASLNVFQDKAICESCYLRNKFSTPFEDLFQAPSHGKLCRRVACSHRRDGCQVSFPLNTSFKPIVDEHELACGKRMMKCPNGCVHSDYDATFPPGSGTIRRFDQDSLWHHVRIECARSSVAMQKKFDEHTASTKQHVDELCKKNKVLRKKVKDLRKSEKLAREAKNRLQVDQSSGGGGSSDNDPAEDYVPSTNSNKSGRSEGSLKRRAEGLAHEDLPDFDSNRPSDAPPPNKKSRVGPAIDNSSSTSNNADNLRFESACSPAAAGPSQPASRVSPPNDETPFTFDVTVKYMKCSDTKHQAKDTFTLKGYQKNGTKWFHLAPLCKALIDKCYLTTTESNSAFSTRIWKELEDWQCVSSCLQIGNSLKPRRCVDVRGIEIALERIFLESKATDLVFDFAEQFIEQLEYRLNNKPLAATRAPVAPLNMIVELSSFRF